MSVEQRRRVFLKPFQYLPHQRLAHQTRPVAHRISFAIAFQRTQLAVVEQDTHTMAAFLTLLAIFLLRIHLKMQSHFHTHRQHIRPRKTGVCIAVNHLRKVYLRLLPLHVCAQRKA